jgi:hypothetical protein
MMNAASRPGDQFPDGALLPKQELSP